MAHHEWDRRAALDQLRARAHSLAEVTAGLYSPGRCAEAVREAVEAGGLRPRRVGSAKDLGAPLREVGFAEVLPGDPDCAGDVAVIPAVAGHPHGHAAMFDGALWISDFVQRDVWGGAAYRTAGVTAQRYRRWPALAAQYRRKFTDMVVKRVVLPSGTRLFKFTEWDIWNGGPPSEWWALRDAQPILGAEGYAAFVRRAEQERVPLREFARRRFAVMWNWNGLGSRTSGMARVQFAHLACAVPAFHGRCAPVRQPLAVAGDERPDVVYEGGDHQVHLPCMSNRELQGSAIHMIP